MHLIACLKVKGLGLRSPVLNWGKANKQTLHCMSFCAPVLYSIPSVLHLAALPTQVMLGDPYTLRLSREGSSPLSLRYAPWVQGGVTFGSCPGIRTPLHTFTFHSGPKAFASGSRVVTTKFLIPQTACYPLSWLPCQPSTVSSFALVGGALPGDGLHIPAPHMSMCTMALHMGVSQTFLPMPAPPFAQIGKVSFALPSLPTPESCLAGCL